MKRARSGVAAGKSFTAYIILLVLIAAITAFFAVSSIHTTYRLERTDFINRVTTLGDTSRLELETDIAKAFEAAEALVSNEALLRWFSGDPDPVYEAVALKDLDSFMGEGRFDTSFAARKDTGDFYTGSRLVDRLSPDDPDDSWFFDSLAMDEPMALNVDRNRELNRTLLWVNAQMRRNGQVIGVAGVGLDMDSLETRLERLLPGKDGKILFTDGRGAVQLSFPLALTGLRLADILSDGNRYVNLNEPADRPYDSRDVLYSVSDIPQLGLSAVVIAPVADLVSPTLLTNRRYSVVSFALIILMLLLFVGVVLKLRETIVQQNRSHDMTILSMSMLAELKDHETGHHIERTRKYCGILVDELRKDRAYSSYLSPGYLRDLERSAPLHDIGKVGIPDQILLKPGKLTEEEFEVIKTHTTLGCRVLEQAWDEIGGASFYTIGIQLVQYHHEKWDGSGYPDGLKGEAIPLSARIMALADVYDALRTVRPYKKAFSHEKTLEIIKSGAGTHFQPELVAIFLKREAEFERVSILLRDDETTGGTPGRTP